MVKGKCTTCTSFKTTSLEYFSSWGGKLSPNTNQRKEGSGGPAVAPVKGSNTNQTQGVGGGTKK